MKEKTKIQFKIIGLSFDFLSEEIPALIQILTLVIVIPKSYLKPWFHLFIFLTVLISLLNAYLFSRIPQFFLNKHPEILKILKDPNATKNKTFIILFLILPTLVIFIAPVLLLIFFL